MIRMYIPGLRRSPHREAVDLLVAVFAVVQYELRSVALQPPIWPHFEVQQDPIEVFQPRPTFKTLSVGDVLVLRRRLWRRHRRRRRRRSSRGVRRRRRRRPVGVQNGDKAQKRLVVDVKFEGLFSNMVTHLLKRDSMESKVCSLRNPLSGRHRHLFLPCAAAAMASFVQWDWRTRFECQKIQFFSVFSMEVIEYC